MAAQKIWWGTWPGALALGLLSLVLVLPGALAGFIVLTIPDTGGSGIDVEAGVVPLWHRIFAVIALVALVVLPVLTTRWARKTWLGYVLLGSALSFVVGAVGLGMFGII